MFSKTFYFIVAISNRQTGVFVERACHDVSYVLMVRCVVHSMFYLENS